MPWSGITGTDPRAIAFWIRMDPTADGGMICYWGYDPEDDSPMDGTQFRIQTNGGRIQVSDRSSTKISSEDLRELSVSGTVVSGVAASGIWHHVLVNYAGGPATTPTSGTAFAGNVSEVDIYIDGVKDLYPSQVIDGGIETNTPQDLKVQIGAWPDPNPNCDYRDFLEADLDSFAIWSRVLQPEPLAIISQDRDADLLSVGQPADLELWLTMGDDPSDTAGLGGTILDQSGNNYNATTQE